MKKDPIFSSLTSELNSIESDWARINPSSSQKLLKVYYEYSSSVASYITTNDIVYSKPISYHPATKIKNNTEFHIREKGYYKFVDLILQAEASANDLIAISTNDEAITKIRQSYSDFQAIENFELLMSKLRYEKMIINMVYDISQELKIEPFTLRIHKMLCHPIDTKPVHIYEAVLKIFSQILEIAFDEIKEKIESKLSSYHFLYTEINPKKIEFIKSNDTPAHQGMRLIWEHNKLADHSLSHKIVDADSPIAQELKKEFLATTQTDIVAPCIPIYRDAIVFRDQEDKIVGYFHICFECARIESHNRTEMPVSMRLIQKLDEVIHSADHKG